MHSTRMQVTQKTQNIHITVEKKKNTNELTNQGGGEYPIYNKIWEG
jgi:hypothetical protein